MSKRQIFNDFGIEETTVDGKKAYKFWRDTYPHVQPWPVPRGKSPGDAFKEGVNLRLWIEAGLK